MQRHQISAREDWRAKVEQLGFSYHTLDGITYWDESVCYEFSRTEADKIEQSTNELYQLCLQAVNHVILNQQHDRFLIPEEFISKVELSWRNKEPSVYGRFDLAWDGSKHTSPKMLEFNADTPTSLFEGAAVQWFWLNDFNNQLDQFNSIHEKLIGRWRDIKSLVGNKPLYFSCLHQFPEDLVNVNYLRDTASQAGIETKFISVHDIGRRKNSFVDLDENPIEYIFKLYPWEWMVNEEFSSLLNHSATQWIEPMWKMILSNKAILPVLWELFPNHPNLLECYFDDPGPMKNYAQKPLLSREGANITLVENEEIISETSGEYGEDGFVYQQLYKLPDFNRFHPVIGSWVIGDQAAGIGIRETNSLVTDNFSRFIPHLIR
ncbi:MAG TPA: glutathionylspermidine synthase family protein [Cyclobacteriaceae bacterium]|nr:glutathionylspermidine synthase family protein [Cyclobacteriaceae bacterium]